MRGFEGKYQVSSHGRARSVDRTSREGTGYQRVFKGRVLRLNVRTDGYVVASIRKDGKSAPVYIHRAVLEAFAGPCPDGMQCCHWDGIRGNNRLDNLRWGTAKENSDDKDRHGTRSCNFQRRRGEDHHGSKFTEAQVREVRRLLSDGEISQRAIARRFSVSNPTIISIKTRKTWGWLV